MAEHEPKFEEYPYLPLINGHIVDTFYGSCDATPKREENINKPAGVNEKKRKTSSGLGDFFSKRQSNKSPPSNTDKSIGTMNDLPSLGDSKKENNQVRIVAIGRSGADLQSSQSDFIVRNYARVAEESKNTIGSSCDNAESSQPDFVVRNYVSNTDEGKNANFVDRQDLKPNVVTSNGNEIINCEDDRQLMPSNKTNESQILQEKGTVKSEAEIWKEITYFSNKLKSLYQELANLKKANTSPPQQQYFQPNIQNTIMQQMPSEQVQTVNQNSILHHTHVQSQPTPQAEIPVVNHIVQQQVVQQFPPKQPSI